MNRYRIALIITLIVIALLIIGVVYLINHIIKKAIDYKCKRDYQYHEFVKANEELDQIREDLDKHNTEDKP